MLTYVLFAAGFYALVKGADLLIDGASSLAERLNVPKLLIGLTIIALGTSMPELAINIFAALKGATAVAFGNVVGSNLANTLLILGTMALVSAPRLHRTTVWRDIPFSLLAALILFTIANDLRIDSIEVFSLTRVDGIVMLGFFVVFIYYMIWVASREKNTIVGEGLEIPTRSVRVIIIMLVLGTAGITLGARWVVDGALALASAFGLSNFVISASVVAIGTSLPELVTSLRAAMRNDTDLAVGNIVGSNIFNILGVLGITAVIAPVAIPPSINVSLLLLIGSTVLLFAFSLLDGRYKLGRSEGFVFLLMYIGYMIHLFT
jgi:cation:H+ antiporter